jgi:hypothetical protein
MNSLRRYRGYQPVFAHVTDGTTGDVKLAQNFDFPKGSIVALARGYVDYHLFTRWNRQDVFFVTRLKANADAQMD